MQDRELRLPICIQELESSSVTWQKKQKKTKSKRINRIPFTTQGEENSFALARKLAKRKKTKAKKIDSTNEQARKIKCQERRDERERGRESVRLQLSSNRA